MRPSSIVLIGARSCWCAYAGFTVATLLCGLASNAHTLLIARAIGGAFGGVSGSLCLAIVSDLVPPERRAAGIGIVMTAFAVAAAIGVPVGLQLAHLWGWRMPFLCVAGGRRGRVVHRVSRGSAGARAFAKRRGQGPGLPGIVARRQCRPRHPLHGGDGARPLQPSSRSFPRTSWATWPCRRNISSWSTLIGGVVSVVTAPQVGKFADRHGRHRVFTYMVLMASVVILAIANAGPLPVWATLVLAGLFFMFASGRFVPGQAIVTLAVPSSRRGAFLSLTSCARDLASGISSTLGGWIVAKQPDGHLVHFNWLGWIAVGAGLCSILLARTVRVNDTGAASPLAKPPAAS